MRERGLDGLTAEMLRTSRAAWWDDAFSRALLDPLPEATRSMADVGCGLGQAALAILPLRPSLSWIGIDADRTRLSDARGALAAAGLERRTTLVHARAEALPLATARVDAVLFVLTLQHVLDPLAALREARRALAPGGVLVAAEPDNLGQHAYFDGLLPDVDAAMRALVQAGRAARHPRDAAIGPRVPALVREAGFDRITVRAHALQTVRWLAAGDWAARKRDEVRALARAGGLDPDGAAVRDFDRAVLAVVESGGPDRVGCALQMVPMFVVSAAPGPSAWRD